METQVVVGVLAALVLAGIIWIAKTVFDTSREVAVIRTILVGDKGDNGLKAEVGELRTKVGLAHDTVQALLVQFAVLNMRAEDSSRREGVERRGGT